MEVTSCCEREESHFISKYTFIYIYIYICSIYYIQRDFIPPIDIRFTHVQEKCLTKAGAWKEAIQTRSFRQPLPGYVKFPGSKEAVRSIFLSEVRTVNTPHPLHRNPHLGVQAHGADSSGWDSMEVTCTTKCSTRIGNTPEETVQNPIPERTTDQEQKPMVSGCVLQVATPYPVSCWRLWSTISDYLQPEPQADGVNVKPKVLVSKISIILVSELST